MSKDKKNAKSNLTTAAILFSVALLFFAGVIVKQGWLR